MTEVQITAELLDELEQKARAAIGDNLQYSNEGCYDPRFGLTAVEQEFAVAASPEVVDALTAHIRSLTEQLEVRNEFLRHVKKCLIKNDEYSPLSHQELDRLIGYGPYAITQEADHE